jgi:hypothetical protein
MIAVPGTATGEEDADRRFPSQSWSDVGLLGFRLGMGPGDVLDVLRSPSSELRAGPGAIERTERSSDPISLVLRVTETSLRAEGQRVEAVFLFHEDRLFSFSLQSGNGGLFENEKNRPAALEWRRAMQPFLTSAFGLPDVIAGDLINAQWKLRDATVDLRAGSVDVEHIPTSVSLSQVRKAQQEVASALLANGEALKRTRPASWSADGWQGLRWGMGLGDVVDRLARSSPESDVMSRGVRDNQCVLTTRLSKPVLGVDVLATLTFTDGALSGIKLTSDHAGPTQLPCSEEAAWYRRARKDFAATYGPGRCILSSKERHKSEVCEWRGAPKFHVSALLVATGPMRCMTALALSDARGQPQVLSARATAKVTPAASWKEAGWLGFRWGMGLGDVQRVLRSASAPFRPQVPFQCSASQDRAGVTLCDLEPDGHEFSLAGLSPRVTWSFLDGRLLDVSLFFSEQDIAAARAAFERLQVLLVEKYGEPKMKEGESSSERMEIVGIAKWKTRDLEVRLFGTVQAGRMTFSISYSDPAPVGTEGTRRDRERL